jgi:hypothetical protein
MQTRAKIRSVIVLVGIVALAGCILTLPDADERPPVDETQTITSSDGLARLFVPRGALPPGVAISQLSARRIDPVRRGLRFAPEGAKPFAMYALSPDGLQLRAPITIGVTLAPAVQGVTAYHLHGDQVELVADPRITVSRDGDRMASIKVTHFSDVVFISTNTRHFDVDLIAPKNGSRFAVGKSFLTTVRVTRNIDTTTALVKQIDGKTVLTLMSTLDREEPWLITGSMETRGALVAKKKEGVPPRTPVSTNTFTISVAAQCQQEGTGTVHLKLEIEYQGWTHKNELGVISNAPMHGLNYEFKNADVVCTSAYDSGLPPDLQLHPDLGAGPGGSSSVGAPDAGIDPDGRATAEPTHAPDAGSALGGASSSAGTDTQPGTCPYARCAGLQSAACFNCCEGNFWGTGLVAACILANGC